MPKFDFIVEAIEDSKYMLNFRRDFDDENGKPIRSETWVKATDFVLRCAEAVYANLSITIETPTISHGPNGSVDVMWRNPNEHRILINIPEAEGHVEFYGDNYGQKVVKGRLDITNEDPFYEIFKLMKIPVT